MYLSKPNMNYIVLNRLLLVNVVPDYCSHSATIPNDTTGWTE